MLPLVLGRFMHLVVLYGYHGTDFDAECLSLTNQGGEGTALSHCW